jgi:hypothetical protein
MSYESDVKRILEILYDIGFKDDFVPTTGLKIELYELVKSCYEIDNCSSETLCSEITLGDPEECRLK